MHFKQVFDAVKEHLLDMRAIPTTFSSSLVGFDKPHDQEVHSIK
jgi:hypothetical protein